MKKTFLLIQLLISISILSHSQGTVNDKDSAQKKAPAPKDRNMFGLYIPRGLKINSDGLADGYIMFAVPNSSSVYLLNRRGEVVHQWKGNYGVMNAYLMDDGSLVQGAEDPDFPSLVLVDLMDEYKKLPGIIRCCGILNMLPKNT